MAFSAQFIFYSFFLSVWVFIHEHSRFTGEQGKGESISLIPLYHFQLLHRHLDISRAIAVENSTSHIAISPCQDPDSKREALVSESQSLTTKLHALAFLIHQTLRKKYHLRILDQYFFWCSSMLIIQSRTKGIFHNLLVQSGMEEALQHVINTIKTIGQIGSHSDRFRHLFECLDIFCFQSLHSR